MNSDPFFRFCFGRFSVCRAAFVRFAGGNPHRQNGNQKQGSNNFFHDFFFIFGANLVKLF